MARWRTTNAATSGEAKTEAIDGGTVERPVADLTIVKDTVATEFSLPTHARVESSAIAQTLQEASLIPQALAARASERESVADFAVLFVEHTITADGAVLGRAASTNLSAGRHADRSVDGFRYTGVACRAGRFSAVARAKRLAIIGHTR